MNIMTFGMIKDYTQRPRFAAVALPIAIGIEFNECSGLSGVTYAKTPRPRDFAFQDILVYCRQG